MQRAIAAAGPTVLRIGEARSTRYALTRDVLGAGRSWSISSIEVSGTTSPVATLHALQQDHWYVESSYPNAPRYLQLGSDRSVFYGLPWYLDVFRPDGFAGRNLVHQWARVLGAPADLRDWTWDHILIAAVRGVTDPPGNWMIGSAISHRNPPPVVAEGERPDAYARLAANAIAGESVGSSVGGEQPKFTAFVDRNDGRHELIVKFSPPQDQPAGRRWADLLVCEHIAADLLRDHGVPTPRTELIDAGARLCLEVERFDRVGQHGRRGTCLLSAITPALGGPATTWLAAVRFLYERDLVAQTVVDRVEFLEEFGQCIGNTDRHLGNLSLMLDGGPPFTLAPIYDMLPMLYRPTAAGELVERELPELHVQSGAQALANEFWQRVCDHALVSEEFRRIAQMNTPQNLR